MKRDKLLVYSDGGKTARCPYASYAAYIVDHAVDWSADFEAHKSLSCRTLHPPLVHVNRQKLFPKRMSNTAAEAVAMRMAVNWAGVWCREHGNISVVEFCSDDLALVQGMRSAKDFNHGRVDNEVRLMRANIKRNLSNVEIRWTWIPGDVMKQTVINH